jgi:peptidyl-prolyl cis-trans isomerase A (cyclophilin A)
MLDRNCTWPRRRAFIAAAALLVAVALGLLRAAPAAARTPSPAPSAQPNPDVRVTTNMGSFVIELRPNRAPLTVANFLRYVETGFYTDTLIHRVVANFVIQGGGHEATAPYALKPTGPPVVNESGNGLENKRGTVGLARGIDPDSGTSQFYINLVDNPELDPLPTRWGYTVFGKVIQGMSVVERIGLVPTGAFGPFKSEAPLRPVVIESVTLVTPSQPGTTPGSTATPATPPASAAPSGQSATPAPAPVRGTGSATESGSASGTSATGGSGSAGGAGGTTGSNGSTSKTASPPASPPGTPPPKP